MEALLTVLSLMFFVLLLAALVGLIKPAIIKQPSRGRAMGVTLIPAVVLLVVIGVLAPKPEKKTDLAAAVGGDTSGKAIAALDYMIISDTSKRDIKRVVEVMLKERIDESALREISTAIYREGYRRTFVMFRVEGNDQAGWATATFDPDLDIRVIGSNKEDHTWLADADVAFNGELIGQWIADWGYEYKLAIYRRGSDVFQKTLYTDGSGKETQLVTKELNGDVLYFDDGDEEGGEYFVISKNGDLEFWSGNGNYYTAPKDL